MDKRRQGGKENAKGFYGNGALMNSEGWYWVIEDLEVTVKESMIDCHGLHKSR